MKAGYTKQGLSCGCGSVAATAAGYNQMTAKAKAEHRLKIIACSACRLDRRDLKRLKE